MTTLLLKQREVATLFVWGEATKRKNLTEGVGSFCSLKKVKVATLFLKKGKRIKIMMEGVGVGPFCSSDKGQVLTLTS